MNRTVYEGRDISEGEVIDLAETMPLFSEHRLILLKDTGFFKSSPELLPDYLKNVPDYLTLVFSESEVDKRSRMRSSKPSCISFRLRQAIRKSR